MLSPAHLRRGYYVLTWRLSVSTWFSRYASRCSCWFVCTTGVRYQSEPSKTNAVRVCAQAGACRREAHARGGEVLRPGVSGGAHERTLRTYDVGMRSLGRTRAWTSCSVLLSLFTVSTVAYPLSTAWFASFAMSLTRLRCDFHALCSIAASIPGWSWDSSGVRWVEAPCVGRGAVFNYVVWASSRR